MAEEAAERFPDDPVTINQRVTAYIAAGRAQEAILMAEKAAKRFPDNPVTNIGLSILHQNTKPDGTIAIPQEDMDRLMHSLFRQSQISSFYQGIKERYLTPVDHTAYVAVVTPNSNRERQIGRYKK